MLEYIKQSMCCQRTTRNSSRMRSRFRPAFQALPDAEAELLGLPVPSKFSRIFNGILCVRRGMGRNALISLNRSLDQRYRESDSPPFGLGGAVLGGDLLQGKVYPALPGPALRSHPPCGCRPGVLPAAGNVRPAWYYAPDRREPCI